MEWSVPLSFRVQPTCRKQAKRNNAAHRSLLPKSDFIARMCRWPLGTHVHLQYTAGELEILSTISKSTCTTHFKFLKQIWMSFQKFIASSQCTNQYCTNKFKLLVRYFKYYRNELNCELVTTIMQKMYTFMSILYRVQAR